MWKLVALVVAVPLVAAAAPERDYDLQAGPIVTYTAGPVTLSALAGVYAWPMLGAGALF